jgi:hypothetical protein
LRIIPTSPRLGTDDGATNASPDDIFDGLEQIKTNNGEWDDCVIILSPKTLVAFIKNDVIPSGDYTMNRAKETGKIPMLGGVPVYVSTNLPTTANGSKVNLVLHKEAFAFAIAQNARVRSQQTLDHLGETIVGDMIYGSKVYRTDMGVVVYGK